MKIPLLADDDGNVVKHLKKSLLKNIYRSLARKAFVVTSDSCRRIRNIMIKQRNIFNHLFNLTEKLHKHLDIYQHFCRI